MEPVPIKTADTQSDHLAEDLIGMFPPSESHCMAGSLETVTNLSISHIRLSAPALVSSDDSCLTYLFSAMIY